MVFGAVFAIRVSTDSSGNQVTGSSGGNLYPSVSNDGRYVAFDSMSFNLISNDTNNEYDIFLKDTANGVTTRVSTDSSGNQANGNSIKPSISADGRYVAFVSDATNLVAGDTNNKYDIFLKDTQTNQTTRVSTDSSGNQVTYLGDSSAEYLILPPRKAISPDGRYVVFSTQGSDLIAGDTNSVEDVFLKDTQTGTLTRVSTDSSGNQANGASSPGSVSANGQYVIFSSTASNLVSGDTNSKADIFIKNTSSGATNRVSTNSSGNQTNGNSSAADISSDGKYISFSSDATNLTTHSGKTLQSGYNVYWKDLQSGAVRLVSVDIHGKKAHLPGFNNSISSDGRYVAFDSRCERLVPIDSDDTGDIFIRDIINRKTRMVTLNQYGNQYLGVGGSTQGHITSNGAFVVFASDTKYLVANDTNNDFDVFRVRLDKDKPSTSAPYKTVIDLEKNKATIIGRSGVAAKYETSSHSAKIYWKVREPNKGTKAKAYVKIKIRKRVGYVIRNGKRVPVYKTVKIVYLKWRYINYLRYYRWYPKTGGTYKFYVYGLDGSGNVQRNIAYNFVVVK